MAPSVYHSDLPNYKEAEAETVFSQSTIQTENGSHFAFDDRTPPGRPPSPATITEYSERDLQRVPPLTPTSEYSIEDERERVKIHYTFKNTKCDHDNKQCITTTTAAI